MKTLSKFYTSHVAQDPQGAIRIVLFTLTIVLFVIGAGAPESGSAFNG